MYAEPFLKNSKIKEKKVFVITDYIGRENTWDFSFYFNRYNHLNREQIKSLHSDGWEIGSHGVSHKSFLSMSLDKVKEELILSKEILEDIIQNEVKSIAPPFSDINQEVYDLCVETGYDSIYIQKQASIRVVDDAKLFYRNNVYSIDRNDNIMNKINMDSIEKKKEDFISSFNNLTILFSNFMKK